MPEPHPERLESWKEIAGYVGKDQRTAMRWETLGMPVHREPGKKGRVYAFKAEITSWLESRKGQPESNQPPIRNRSSLSTPNLASGRILSLAAASVGSLAILYLALVVFPRLRRQLPPVKVTFTSDVVHAWDDHGHEVWSHTYPALLRPEAVPAPLDELVRIGDFRGLGDTEVLVVAPYRSGPNADGPVHVEVDLFSSRGELIWSYVPTETFQFGEHSIGNPWSISDVFVSGSHSAAIWIAVVQEVWGNSFIVQLDPRNGHPSLRFVNTGVVYKLNEWKTERANYLLVGGFNNEYEGGSLAIFNEAAPFAASPQTGGTRHKCISCPPGAPDMYVVFPRSEINEFLQNYENPIRYMIVREKEWEISKFERQQQRLDGGLRTIYIFNPKPSLTLVSLRYDSTYDLLHRKLSSEKKLDHTLENCPERLHPKPVRLWTPTTGWTDLYLKPAKANQ